MESQTLSPETVEERIVWHTIRSTYLFFALGALYVVGPVLAWALLFIFVFRFMKSKQSGLKTQQIPTAVWLWCAGMTLMLLSLIVGHMDFDLGIAKLIKSSIGWAKGWALLAIFILVGCMNIRPQIVYRACTQVCLHTLLLLPVFVGAWLLGLPQTLYISPLQIIGGPGPEFFSLSLYEIDPGSGRPRWRLFTPWAPALGFMANIFFIFSLQEKNITWRWIGISGSVIMVLLSASRLALVALLLVWITSWAFRWLRSHYLPFFVACGFSLIGIVAVPLLEMFDRLLQSFRMARADSTRVREALGRIAVERWQNEAPIWGHGIVERGPHMVEFMPIGSHHSWFGLLFVKGIVGFAALALPLLFSLFQLSWWCGKLPVARVGLAMAMLLLLYTFGENLEILSYLIWPALIVLGIAHREIAKLRSLDNTGDRNHVNDKCHYASLQCGKIRQRCRELGTTTKLWGLRTVDRRRFVPRWQHRNL